MKGACVYLQKISDEVLAAEYQAVYCYVLSICKNKSEAEDITQETFLKAMKAKTSFNEKSSLYTWLCAIAKNLWLSKIKKQKNILVDENIENNQDILEKSLEQNLLEKDISLHIHRVLHTLDEPYKEVFTLRVFGELSFIEIAKLFSKTESWARVTYHRSKKKIIELLRKEKIL